METFPIILFICVCVSFLKDVFLMIRRQKMTIFTDAKETSTVHELKKIIEGITKRSPDEQKLFREKEELDNTKTLGDCGLTNNTAKAQAPAMLGLTFKLDGKLKLLNKWLNSWLI